MFHIQNYPDIDRRGAVGLELNADEEVVSVQNRSEQPFYFLIHLLEPVEGNKGAIDFDLYSSAPRRRETIHSKAIETWKPALTPTKAAAYPRQTAPRTVSFSCILAFLYRVMVINHGLFRIVIRYLTCSSERRKPRISYVMIRNFIILPSKK